MAYKDRAVVLRRNKSHKDRTTEKYDSAIHDKEIQSILSSGGFMEDFCRKYNICDKTYYNWRTEHTSFAAAIRKGNLYGRGEWMKKPMKHIGAGPINHLYWLSIMNYYYKMDRVKVSLKGNESAKEILETIAGLYAKSKIKEKQVDKWINIAMSKIKVVEMEQLQEDIKELKKLAGIDK